MIKFKLQSLAFRGLHSLVLVTILVSAPTNRRPRGRNTLVLYSSPAHHSPASTSHWLNSSRRHRDREAIGPIHKHQLLEGTEQGREE